jgi:hypothetical protein
MKRLYKKIVHVTNIIHFEFNDSGVPRGCGKQLKMWQNPFSYNLGICVRREDHIKLYWVITLHMNNSQTSWKQNKQLSVSLSCRDWYRPVGIATRYLLEKPGISSQWRRDFQHPSRPSRGPTRPPIQWITGLFPGGKRPGHGVDHLPPTGAGVKERVKLYSPSRLSCPRLGRTLPLPFLPLRVLTVQSLVGDNANERTTLHERSKVGTKKKNSKRGVMWYAESQYHTREFQ